MSPAQRIDLLHRLDFPAYSVLLAVTQGRTDKSFISPPRVRLNTELETRAAIRF